MAPRGNHNCGLNVVFLEGCEMVNSLTKLSSMTDYEILNYAKQTRDASTSTDLEIELAERLSVMLVQAGSNECQDVFDEVELEAAEQDVMSLISACGDDIAGTLDILNMLRDYGYTNRTELEACLALVGRMREVLTSKPYTKEH